MLARTAVPVALLAVTAVATIGTFWFFDRGSHSASDTIRPFLITIVPVWLLVGVAVHRLGRARRATWPGRAAAHRDHCRGGR